MTEVTEMLQAIASGKAHVAGELLPLVYDELRRLASRKLAVEKPGQTLQPTALVHEAYLRLVGSEPARRWDGRAHFFAAAAEAMRRILVENARRRHRLKHGGGHQRRDLDLGQIACRIPDDDLLGLDDAMTRLAAEDPDKARLVALRFFVGLTNDEAAELLGISSATANRRWRYARAWLHRALRQPD